MVIAGGVYYELCSFPEWNALYGSGGRAAAALSAFDDIELHTFVPEEYEESVRIALAPFPVAINVYRSEVIYDFHYVHALAKPIYYTAPTRQVKSPPQQLRMAVKSEVALRFGFMEGDAVVEGEWVTYDPQSPSPQRFSENGSSATHLAYVLNESELAALYPDDDLDAAARKLLKEESAEVILIKRGVFGVRVVTRDRGAASVPAYKTANVFKIGSGDVFSASFAYHWGVKREDPFAAARTASQSAAWYCDTRSLPIPETEILDALTPVSGGHARPIYLAGPFFTVGQRLLIEETRNILTRLGANVFSPYHDIGLGEPNVVAPADIAAIERSSVILALAEDLDLGTVFEIGYGTASNVPSIVQALRLPEHQFSMVLGTENTVERDYATALYKAIWASLI